MSNAAPSNVDEIIKHFGGRNALYRKLQNRNIHLSVKTIEKWKEKGHIPTPRLKQLVDLSKAEGRPIDLNLLLGN